MLVLIDNFCSFTYNLVHAFEQLGQIVLVVRNNAVSVEQIKLLKPSLVVIGPGPGGPKTAGISKPAVNLAQEGIPVLGICLGNQVIAEVFGGEIVRASKAVHGKCSPIYHQGEGVFAGLSQGFQATRYHSLIVEQKSLPTDLKPVAWTEEGEVMGIAHQHYPIEGVQFHPESIASKEGMRLLRNALSTCMD